MSRECDEVLEFEYLVIRDAFILGRFQFDRVDTFCASHSSKFKRFLRNAHVEQTVYVSKCRIAQCIVQDAMHHEAWWNAAQALQTRAAELIEGKEDDACDARTAFPDAQG